MNAVAGYRIVVGRNRDELEKRVVALLDDGWIPSGSMVYAPPTNAAGMEPANSPHFMQPMVQPIIAR